MSLQIFNSRILSVTQRFTSLIVSRSYAKPVVKKSKVGKAGPIVEKPPLYVEKDPHKLVNYVCGSNIYIDGEDVKIKPESEYPDWLWDIHVGPPKKLEELDPNTKTYWRHLRKMKHRHNMVLLSLNRKINERKENFNWLTLELMGFKRLCPDIHEGY